MREAKRRLPASVMAAGGLPALELRLPRLAPALWLLAAASSVAAAMVLARFLTSAVPLVAPTSPEHPMLAPAPLEQPVLPAATSAPQSAPQQTTTTPLDSSVAPRSAPATGGGAAG